MEKAIEKAEPVIPKRDIEDGLKQARELEQKGKIEREENNY